MSVRDKDLSCTGVYIMQNTSIVRGGAGEDCIRNGVKHLKRTLFWFVSVRLFSLG